MVPFPEKMSLNKFKSLKEALEYYKKRRKELEEEMEYLHDLREKGKISEEEFEERKKKIEREFIEVMDRITQLNYIANQTY